MFRTILGRLIQVIPIVFGVLTLIFFIMRLIPGDPAAVMLGSEATLEQIEALRNHLGLNRPITEQYLDFIVRAVKGDLGISFFYREPAVSVIAQSFMHTARLAIASMVIMIIIGVSLGVLAAVQRNRPTDVAVLIISLIGIAAPSFWLGLLLLWLFSGILGWFPLTGAGRPGDSLSILYHLVLPAIVLGIGGAGIIMRMTRSALLETLNEDYVRTARSKGLPERFVIYRHALKNALIPIITIAGLNMGHLLAGAILVETVFTRPGLGRVVIQAISSRDYPLLQAVIAVYAIVFVAVNLFVDVTYTVVDPRISHT